MRDFTPEMQDFMHEMICRKTVLGLPGMANALAKTSYGVSTSWLLRVDIIATSISYTSKVTV